MKNLLTKKLQAKKVKNQRFSSSIQLICKSVWQITFSGWTFSRLFPQIWNQRKILQILNTRMSQKNKKIFGVNEYICIWVYVRTSRMQIRKKWLNQLKNFFNKHFWENYLAPFCWWISSSCENHCTLTYMRNGRHHFTHRFTYTLVVENDVLKIKTESLYCRPSRQRRWQASRVGEPASRYRCTCKHNLETLS